MTIARMPDAAARAARRAPLLLLLLTLAGPAPAALSGASTQPAAAEEIPNRHSRPIIEEDGRLLLWAGEDEGATAWFDMTGSTVDPRRFQYGIGKDTIPSIDAPEFVPPADARLAARGVTGDTRVLGVQIDGVARAYPVNVLDLHEVVNDEFGGRAYAVLW